MTIETLNNKKFLFIGGLHRSGTTVIGRIIGSNPAISSLYAENENTEGQFYQNVYPTDEKYGGVGRFAFREDAHLTENSELATEENAIKIFSDWEKYWNTDKEYLSEKTPRNIIISRFLQALFPNSYFIFITRHPIAVSLATQKWSKTSLLGLTEHWLKAHQILHEDVKYLKNYKIIRYEDFVQNPQKILQELSSFLNIENKFEYSELKKNINSKYYSNWDDLKESGTAWNRRIFKVFKKIKKNKFPIFVNYQNCIEDIEFRFEKQINEFGYSFKNKKII